MATAPCPPPWSFSPLWSYTRSLQETQRLQRVWICPSNTSVYIYSCNLQSFIYIYIFPTTTKPYKNQANVGFTKICWMLWGKNKSLSAWWETKQEVRVCTGKIQAWHGFRTSEVKLHYWNTMFSETQCVPVKHDVSDKSSLKKQCCALMLNPCKLFRFGCTTHTHWPSSTTKSQEVVIMGYSWFYPLLSSIKSHHEPSLIKH